MADTLNPDICVVGGGPAGLAVALGAAREGVSVVLVERGAFGGVYHRSAVRVRALSAAAATRAVLRRAPAMGVSGAPLQVNLSQVGERIEQAVADAAVVVRPERLEALGVTVMRGAARFLDARRLDVGGKVLRPRRVVLAVGARRPPPQIEGIGQVRYLTADDPVAFDGEPSHVVVLGAGPAALEAAQAYRRLGIDATVIATARVLAGFDREQAEIVIEGLRAEGVNIRSGFVVEHIRAGRDGMRLTLSEPNRPDAPATAIDASHLFIAGGRHPDVESLGLGEGGIRHGPDGIAVDRRMRTSNPRVFAVGDCIAGPPTSARAVAQAEAVLAALLFRPAAGRASAESVRTAHTDPGIASGGLSEDDARTAGREVTVVRTPFVETLQADLDQAPNGFLKAVIGRNGRVLGASAVGRGAVEVLAPWSLAVGQGLHVDDLAGISVPTPSYGEITRLTARAWRPEGKPGWRWRVSAALRRLG